MALTPAPAFATPPGQHTLYLIFLIHLHILIFIVQSCFFFFFIIIFAGIAPK
ncbi:hypothetical protein H1R20_g13063, partial [Candolleomyces eurysporus]